MLEIDHLTVCFENFVAVSDLSLKIAPSERVGLVGESGSGKSVTALAVMGLLSGHTQQGKLLWKGKEAHLARGKQISLVMQDPFTALNPTMRIGKQLTEGAKLTRAEGEALLKRLELDPTLYDAYPHHLSGGMRQRVAIGIAIAPNPELIIADEPTTALDAEVREEILALLHSLECAVLLISHDLTMVERFCDRVVVMYGGMMMEEYAQEARHPYTCALKRAMPGHGKLQPIPGSPPVGRIEGCPFAPRCERATAQCAQEPPMKKGVRCWNL